MAQYCDSGLRSFFVYRDAEVTAATKGQVLVQLVRAARKCAEAKGGAGFHFHTADVHVVYMVRGWARFDYDGVDTLVEAGDCVHQNSWRSSLPAHFATTEITPSAIAAAAPPTVGH